MWLIIKSDVATKFATQWTQFFLLLKLHVESYVVTKFEPNTTFLARDIEVGVKTAVFANLKVLRYF